MVEDTLFSFSKNIHGEKVPEIKADFEKFFLRNIGALDDILEPFLRVIFQKFDILIGFHGITGSFNQSDIGLKHRGNADAHLFTEGLKISLLLGSDEILVLFSQISVLGHVCDLFNEKAKVHASLLLEQVLLRFLFVLQTDLRNFCHEFDGFQSCCRGCNQIS